MEYLLEVNDLHTSFFTHVGEVKAVRGVSFALSKGEIIGIVGESGCGKSVTMLSVLGILDDAGKVKQGHVYLNGKDLISLRDKDMEKIRGNEIAMIFQDPMTSLNPVYTIGNQMTEHLIKHKKVSKKEAYGKAVNLLKSIGIPSPEERIMQYPHEFSGGMRQRVMIAMALMTEPKLLIADEPTTALDVTIQAQILDIMRNINRELGTSIILITHDLGVVADICHRVNVMYGGLIIESAKVDDIYYNPQHPYTWGLLNSVPNPKFFLKERLKPIDGQPPDLLKPPVGCPFAVRCEYAMGICKLKMPQFYQVEEKHKVACWLQHPKAFKADFIERTKKQPIQATAGKGGFK
jgi:oligopeptide transport system ATP-binding protein